MLAGGELKLRRATRYDDLHLKREEGEVDELISSQPKHITGHRIWEKGSKVYILDL